MAFKDRYGMLKGWVIALIFASIIIAFMVVVFVGGNIAARHACTQKADMLEMHHRYSFWTDCMVSEDGKHWYPLDQYRQQY